MIYMVSYDLHKPEKNYPRIKEAIESLGYASRPLYSLWFVESQLSTTDVRDYLKKFVDKDDRLLVMQASKSWASFRLDKAQTDWLKVFINEQVLVT